MKKIILLLSVFFYLGMNAIAQTVEAKQNTLITKKTATWCSFCGTWGWDFFENLVEDAWDHVKFYDRSSNFADVIRPNGLNIIDFLEITTDFFLIEEQIRKIHDKLDKGVAVICLQKKKGAEMGRGAEFSLEKPRIYFSLDYRCYAPAPAGE